MIKSHTKISTTYRKAISDDLITLILKLSPYKTYKKNSVTYSFSALKLTCEIYFQKQKNIIIRIGLKTNPKPLKLEIQIEF